MLYQLVRKCSEHFTLLHFLEMKQYLHHHQLVLMLLDEVELLPHLPLLVEAAESVIVFTWWCTEQHICLCHARWVKRAPRTHGHLPTPPLKSCTSPSALIERPSAFASS